MTSTAFVILKKIKVKKKIMHFAFSNRIKESIVVLWKRLCIV